MIVKPSREGCSTAITKVTKEKELTKAIEKALGKEAKKNMLPLQAGDVPATFANVDQLVADTGFKPATNHEVGIQKFIDWYLDYYKVTV